MTPNGIDFFIVKTSKAIVQRIQRGLWELCSEAWQWIGLHQTLKKKTCTHPQVNLTGRPAGEQSHQKWCGENPKSQNNLFKLLSRQIGPKPNYLMNQNGVCSCWVQHRYRLKPAANTQCKLFVRKGKIVSDCHSDSTLQAPSNATC